MAKKTILYVGQPIVFAHEHWASFQDKFEILFYDLTLKEDVFAAFSSGGKYSNIDGIMRPNLSANMLPPLDKELISHLPASCKIISYCNHGYDGQDVEELEKRGIWYCNGAGCATESTADIGLFLILSVFRFTTFCERTLRETRSANVFNVHETVKEALEPDGKILGIVGMGGIGVAVAQRAQALGMNIHYFNRRKKADAEKQLGDPVFHGNLESLLRVSDCVLLACPHNSETHHIINAKSIREMKKGSRIVNIGRGKCVDEAAVVEALECGHISSAGMDVFSDEPEVHPGLLKSFRVTLLPHMAGSTVDTDRRFEETAMKNIEQYFLGNGKPLTPVNSVTEGESSH